MDCVKVDKLILMLNRGDMIGWYHEGTLMIINRIEDIDDEMRGYFLNGRGMYVDLWNVEPGCLVVVEFIFGGV